MAPTFDTEPICQCFRQILAVANVFVRFIFMDLWIVVRISHDIWFLEYGCNDICAIFFVVVLLNDAIGWCFGCFESKLIGPFAHLYHVTAGRHLDNAQCIVGATAIFVETYVTGESFDFHLVDTNRVKMILAINNQTK